MMAPEVRHERAQLNQRGVNPLLPANYFVIRCRNGLETGEWNFLELIDSSSHGSFLILIVVRTQTLVSVECNIT